MNGTSFSEPRLRAARHPAVAKPSLRRPHDRTQSRVKAMRLSPKGLRNALQA